MFDLKSLEGIKLVDEGNLMSVERAKQELEAAFMQGAGGWGVRRETSLVLRLARELHDTTIIAAAAEDNQRLLKGLQMQNGKLKKQLAAKK